MAEFDLNELLNLSKVKLFLDLSKVFPTKVFNYLTAFLPGLFFEVSVLLANPDLIHRLLAQQDFAVGRYVAIAIVLFLAFIVGNAFMLVDAFIQYAMGYLYALLNFCWKQLCKWPLKPFLDWLLTKPSWARRRWVVYLNRYVIDTGYMASHKGQELWRCWLVFAQRLVSVRYGIEPIDLKPEAWAFLYWALGSPTPEETRGDLFMIATHATGWAGLAATLIAPTLENRYYIAFCIFMILNGLLHDYYVVKRKVDPRIAGYLNLRAILREFRDGNYGKAKGESATID